MLVNPMDGTTYKRYWMTIDAEPLSPFGRKHGHKVRVKSPGNNQFSFESIRLETKEPNLHTEGSLMVGIQDRLENPEAKEVTGLPEITAFSFLLQEGFSPWETMRFPTVKYFEDYKRDIDGLMLFVGTCGGLERKAEESDFN